MLFCYDYGVKKSATILTYFLTKNKLFPLCHSTEMFLNNYNF